MFVVAAFLGKPVPPFVALVAATVLWLWAWHDMCWWQSRASESVAADSGELSIPVKTTLPSNAQFELTIFYGAGDESDLEDAKSDLKEATMAIKQAKTDLKKATKELEKTREDLVKATKALDDMEIRAGGLLHALDMKIEVETSTESVFSDSE